jgi:hypothetical protein
LLLRLALALATSFLNDSWNGPSLLLISTSSWFQYYYEVRVHTGNLSTFKIANTVGLYWIGDWKSIRLISDTVFFFFRWTRCLGWLVYVFLLGFV